MDTVKVRNTQPRLLQVMDPGPMGSNGKRGPSASVRTLKPGVNLVPRETVDAMRDSVVVKSWLKDGWLVIDEATKLPSTIHQSLDGLKVPEAVALVKDTLDVALLEKWRETPNLAPKVLAAIDNQLAEIDKHGGEKPPKE